MATGKRRLVVKQDLELGYGTTTIPTDSGGTRAANKMGIQTFLGDQHISAQQFSGSNLGIQLANAMAALQAAGTGGVVHAGTYGAATITADPFTGITSQILLIFDSVQLTSSVSITVPSNITVRFERGARLTMNTGTTLSWSGGIEAGLFQIFGTTGTINLYTARVHGIFPEWFGAVGNTSTDDSTAFNKALAALSTSAEGTLRLRNAEYGIGATLNAGSVRVIGVGQGSNLKALAALGATNMWEIDCDDRYGLQLQDFQCELVAAGAAAFSIRDAHFWRIDHVFVRSGTDTAFKFVGNCFSGLLINCTASNSFRAFELNRSGAGEGSGGVSVVRFSSGGITNIGAIVDSSADVTLTGCELQVSSNGPALWIRGNSVPTKQIAVSVQGGQFSSNNEQIRIGDAGVGNTLGVSIVGALIGLWTSPTANSIGINITSGDVSGVDIRGNQFQGLNGANPLVNAIKFTGVIDANLSIGANSYQDVTNIISSSAAVVASADASTIPQTASSIETEPYVFMSGAAPVNVYRPAGRIYSSNVEVGNVGAGEDTLMSYSIPAGAFAATGRALRLTAWGTTAANANNKTLKFYIGSDLVATLGPTAANNTRWIHEYVITKAATADREVWCQTVSVWNNAAVVPDRGEANQATGSAILLKFTGEATSDSDIVQRGMLVEMMQ